MSKQLTQAALIAKAVQALASAKVLVDTGDADGACNRAYYAMFDAARAALQASGFDVVNCKTHKGVLNAFSDHLVKNGPVPKDIGRLLKQAETRRYVADYEGDTITISDAYNAAREAEIFVMGMRSIAEPKPSCKTCGANPCVCPKGGSSGMGM